MAKRESDHPCELRRIGGFVEVEVPRQRVDGRDSDDRSQELLLEDAEIDVDEAVGPVRMVAGDDLADIVFVAGEDDDEDEICREGQVDEVEHVDQEIVPSQGWHLYRKLEQVGEETEEDQDKAESHAQEKRRHQPTAEEDRRLNAAPDRQPHGTSLSRFAEAAANAPATQPSQFASRLTAV